MNIKKKELLELLVAHKYITEADKLLIAEKTLDDTITEFLLSEKFLTKDLFGQALSEYYKVDYYDLNSNPLTAENLKKIKEEIALKFNVLYINESDSQVFLTTSDPSKSEEIKASLQAEFPSKEILIRYSTDEDINTALSAYRKPIQTRLAEILDTYDRFTSKLISELIKEAITQGASDIHFEPLVETILLRFRIDGVLQEIVELDKELYENILNRIKIMAGVRIDQHFSPQDGAVRFELDGEFVDLRVSIAPTIEGEKIVIRVLSNYTKKLGLEDLGMSKDQIELLIKATAKTNGMILTTGPTGSGKTTTLYSVLKKLQSSTVNITTIEDPVEFRIKGVNQIQVDQFNDVTFAKGLRSIVRQDPDIILVGEIRDHETAEIAVNAALTGHLLLSTFHANDAASAIPRLLDMGIEPFLLSSTLNLIIAQRLVRRICDHCKVSKEFSEKEVSEILPEYKDYFSSKTIRLFSGKGCDFCNHTGYRGRMGIYEFIVVTEEIMDLIMNSSAANEIWRMARVQGSKTFFDDGIEKVKTGIITIDELIRVAPIAFSNEIKTRSQKISKTK